MFIVSNLEINRKEKWKDFFTDYSSKIYFKKTDDYLFLLEGFLFFDFNKKIKQIIHYFLNQYCDISFPNYFIIFKGNYSDLFINYKKSKSIFFNDQLGHLTY